MNNKKVIRLTEADLNRIVKQTIMEMVAPMGGKLERLYNKIMQLIEPVQDKGSLDKNSTYLMPSKVHYDVKFNGNRISVRRTDISQDGSVNKDSWILTDRNWKEKWDGYDMNPLKDQINYDRKCARFFKNEYGNEEVWF